MSSGRRKDKMMPEPLTISFRVPAVPVAQPRHRSRVVAMAGKAPFVQTYAAPNSHPVHSFRATVRLAAQDVYHGPPIAGPVSLTILFLMPRPGRLTRKTRPNPREWHIQRPDLDNLEKSVKDALKGTVWKDDSQVCVKSTEKKHAAGDEQPGVEIVIRELVPEPARLFGG